ncbi:TetR/AcrR family transcriptional regulator [Saccharothrix deserti]|uniref:TetR/AcrR family transcriptional regulator n=1 Tax=Saccharothrix deserti TaxID=2593674 RepID=UPI00131C9255|nr:TetR/AcrR family transcriptional regulator [Saccharothrix deserti]
MTNSRAHILDSALALLRSGGTVSLESAAQRSGLTKPGLMHHFRTKEALMVALVDHVVDRWERELADRLPTPPTEASARDRVLAYLDWALSGEFDNADLVMLADPRLRDRLTTRWGQRLAPWIDLPADLPTEVRARLAAVRMLADGVWLADAIEVFPLAADERHRVRAAALRLLDDPTDDPTDGTPADEGRTMGIER